MTPAGSCTRSISKRSSSPTSASAARRSRTPRSRRQSHHDLGQLAPATHRNPGFNPAFEGTAGGHSGPPALARPPAVGAVWRPPVPAVIAGFVGYTVARIFVQHWLRERYQTPLSSSWARGAAPNLNGAWVLSEGPSDRLGHPLPNAFGVLQSCSRAINNHVR